MFYSHEGKRAPLACTIKQHRLTVVVLTSRKYGVATVSIPLVVVGLILLMLSPGDTQINDTLGLVSRTFPSHSSTYTRGRLVATLGAKSNSRKINRKAIQDVDVPTACRTIKDPAAPMALRLQGNLLSVVQTLIYVCC
jgi:hypothetical protein